MNRLSRYYRLCTSSLRLLPDFVIIGAPRCGTTFLYEALSSHPCVIPADEKEIHYFDSPLFKKGTLWYRSHFPLAIEKHYARHVQKRNIITGEASPFYLLHPHAARRMAGVIPQAKLIVLLRNPVDRAYSHYNRKMRKWESLSFEEAIEAEEERLQGEVEKMLADEYYHSSNFKNFSYLRRGIYVDQLQVFARYFDKSQMLILKSEEMFENAPQLFQRILEFLELPAWQPEQFAPANVGRYDDMKPETRQRLNEYFAPHNQRLYDYLGVDFGW